MQWIYDIYLITYQTSCLGVLTYLWLHIFVAINCSESMIYTGPHIKRHVLESWHAFDSINLSQSIAVNILYILYHISNVMSWIPNMPMILYICRNKLQWIYDIYLITYKTSCLGVLTCIWLHIFVAINCSEYMIYTWSHSKRHVLVS